MAWYDFYSAFYDIDNFIVERIRRLAVEELRLQSGSTVLDIACGTGANFRHLEREIGTEGVIIGVDYSKGMLTKARQRVAKHNWENIFLVRDDARNLSVDLLRRHAGLESMDGALCTLGLTVVPDWQTVFEKSYELLNEGGRYSIMDWHSRWKYSPVMLIVNFIGRADAGRRVWDPLRQRSVEFNRTTFWGGRLYVASGTKSGSMSGRTASAVPESK